MNQQINLYLPEFRAKKDALSALVMGQILVSIVAVMVIVASVDIYTERGLRGELAKLNGILQQETEKSSKLSEVLTRRSQNAVLIDRLDQAEAQLETSREIRSFLSQEIAGQAVGPRYVSRLEGSNSLIRGLQFSPRIYRSDAGSKFFEFELSSSNE